MGSIVMGIIMVSAWTAIVCFAMSGKDKKLSQASALAAVLLIIMGYMVSITMPIVHHSALNKIDEATTTLDNILGKKK